MKKDHLFRDGLFINIYLSLRLSHDDELFAQSTF